MTEEVAAGRIYFQETHGPGSACLQMQVLAGSQSSARAPAAVSNLHVEHCWLCTQPKQLSHTGRTLTVSICTGLSACLQLPCKCSFVCLLALQLKKSDSFESVHSAASFESADEQQAAAAGPNIKQAGTYATAPTYASR